jgi:nitrous oxidase accessory protein NosD
VSNEAELRSALASAQPGSVVAVTGTIAIAGEDELDIPEGVTLTCAEAGAGIIGTVSTYALLAVNAPNVTVAGLAIDGTNSFWPLLVENGFPRSDVRNVTIDGNSVICGDGCIFIVGAPSTTITNNSLEARRPASSGIHIQGDPQLRTDGSRVENNVIRTLVPSGAPAFGAIRPRDGSHVVVRGNTILGPWSNGIALTEITDGVFEHNSIEGATRSGYFFAGNPLQPISVRSSLFRANAVTTATGPAFLVQRACGNVFVGNRITVPSATPAMTFALNTGANAVLGEPVLVLDNGQADCDLDGIADPNTITGPSRKGGYAGEIIAPVMEMAGRIHGQ